MTNQRENSDGALAACILSVVTWRPRTVGSGDATAPTPFKVQDGLMFNAIKPGDKVSFTAERVDGVMTINKLTKE